MKVNTRKKIMDYALNYIRTKYPNYVAVASEYVEVSDTPGCLAYYKLVVHSDILFMQFVFYIDVYGDINICDKLSGYMTVIK